MLGLVAPHDHGKERRLLLPTARDGHPEHGPGDTTLGVADLARLAVGVVDAAGEADGVVAVAGLGDQLRPPGIAVAGPVHDLGLEDARADALATLARTQRGPAVVPLRERAGQ
jgi:hypothetical protein